MCLEIRTQVEDRENRRGEAEAEKHILCFVQRPAGETARTKAVSLIFTVLLPFGLSHNYASKHQPHEFYGQRQLSPLSLLYPCMAHVSGSLFKCFCGCEASEHSGIVEQKKPHCIYGFILSPSNDKYSLLILLSTVFLGSYRVINPAYIFFSPLCKGKS